MKALKWAPIAAALALGAVTTSAMAQNYYDRDHDRRHEDHDGYYRHDHGRHNGWDRDRDDRRYYDGRARYNDGRWDRRGPPPWARGRDYRSYGYQNVYVVPPGYYRSYGLYAPRPGYRWVRDDTGHFMMVAIASGIISDILFHAIR